MEYVYSVIKILAGCGVLLLGFKLLSENMEKIAGNSLKALFNKTSDKKLAGVGMGAVTTAVVQSSAITTVMVVGFVNAGIMSLNQATTIIMGANIGTTITALFFMIFAFAGMAMEMFSKNDKVKSAGLALAGLGLVFIGLGILSDQMEMLNGISAVNDFLAKPQNPFFLVLVGVLVTALFQSSSAVTSIIITMAANGLIIGGGGNYVLYIILGSNIGSCVTALLSSIGTSVNARRASVIHLLFNVFGSLLFMIPLLFFPSFMDVTFNKWFPGKPETQIAMFHTAFNGICTVLFLPFTKGLVRLATLLVSGKKKGESSETTFMDKRFLSTPAIAISQLKKETFRMADMSMESLQLAFDGFIERDVSASEQVISENESIAALSAQISDYLVQVSASGISLHDEKRVSALHNNVGDIVRIAELADNLTKYTRRVVTDNLAFSASVNEKLTDMHDLLKTQYDTVKHIILDKEYSLLEESDKLEDRIDNMRKELVADHISRMERGECRPQNNPVFINLVCNLERIGDHMSYIAHSLDNI